MHRSSPPFALALLICSSPAAAAPAEYVPPGFITEPARLPPELGDRPRAELTLGDALARAVRHNLGVELSRESLRVAELSVLVAGAPFEPVIGASWVHNQADSPAVTRQEGELGEIITAASDQWNAFAEHRLWTGTQLRLSMGNARASTTAQDELLPLSFVSRLSIELRQPLLRGFGFGIEIPRADVLRAELTSRAERERLAAAVVEVVERTELSYWDVVQALKAHAVQQTSLQRAEEQLELTRRQIAAGVLAPSDLLSAESTLAQRRLAMVQAEAAIEQAWDRLRTAMNLPEPEWQAALVPVQAPAFTPVEMAEEEALTTALRERPELRREQYETERAELELRRARNDQLPQLDFGLSYSLVGQGERYPDALEEIGAQRAPGWTAFGTLTWTPLNRAANASAAIRRSAVRQAQLDRELQTLQIRTEVRDALRRVETAERQVQAAARFRDLAARSLDVEQRKFLNGTSSNFFIAQRQEELARAELAELEAVLNHQRATLGLQRGTGRLLEARRIELDVAAR